MKNVSISAVPSHERGKVHHVIVNKRAAQMLLTFHVWERLALWRLTDQAASQTLLFPEEVLRGHRGRFIAHRRTQSHVIRGIYKYVGQLPVVITVYNLRAKRYFQGGI